MGRPAASIPIAGGTDSINARQLRFFLLGLGFASAMQFYTFDSINLILPDMAGAFGASRDEASWILISFSAAMFLGTPLARYFARRIGMLRYILGSIVVFTACSIASSLSSRLEEMLVFRAVEGFAGASLNFWWRGSVYTFLTGAPRSASMMRVSVMLYCATAMGLLVSGYLVDHLTWRFLCLIDISFAAAAVSLLLRFYPRLPVAIEQQTVPIDRFGILFLGIGLVSLQIILARGPIDDWFDSSFIVALMWIAALGFGLFILRDLGSVNPIMRLWMLRDRNVLASVLIGTFTGMILAGALYALPEYLRGVDPQPRSASQTGHVMCVYALAAVCIRPLVTPAIGRFGQRKVTTFALASLIASMLLMAHLLTTGTPAYEYAVPLILYSFCLAPLLSAVGSGTAARVPGAAQMDAVAIYMTFRQFGTVLGVALVNSVIERRESLHSSRLFEHLRAGRPVLDSWLHAASGFLVHRGGRTPVDASNAAVGLLREVAGQQAAVLAYADAFLIMAVIGLLALAFVPLMSPPVRKT